MGRHLRQALIRWLTGRPGPLFGPPVLGEIQILVTEDGIGHVKAPLVSEQADHAMIARAIMRAGAWYAESHGLHIPYVGPPVPEPREQWG